MMFEKVTIKGSICELFFQQGKLLCRLEVTQKVVSLFPVVAAARLMMDKASINRVRVVLEAQSQPFIDIQFKCPSDRDAFATEMRSQKVSVKAESNTSTHITSSGPTLPTTTASGLTDHLDGLFTSADRRGTLSLFQVLDGLVDTSVIAEGSNTPCLRPLTDQMISDVFAAVPSLAAAHEILVTRKGLSEKEFWASVLGKYMCFKASPLDALVGGATTQQLDTNETNSFFRYINVASSNPLRRAKGKRNREDDHMELTKGPGRNQGFIVIHRCCSQPREKATQLGTLECKDVKLTNFGATMARQIGDVQTNSGEAVKEAWMKFWHAIDASNYDSAHSLYSLASQLDSNRPYISRRALMVLESIRDQ